MGPLLPTTALRVGELKQLRPGFPMGRSVKSLWTNRRKRARIELFEQPVGDVIGWQHSVHHMEIGTFDTAEDARHCGQGVPSFEEVFSVSALADAPHPFFRLHIKENQKSWWWSELLVHLEDFFRIKPSSPLVSSRGEVISIHDNDLTPV